MNFPEEGNRQKNDVVHCTITLWSIIYIYVYIWHININGVHMIGICRQ